MTDELESFDELSAAQSKAAQQGSAAAASVAKHAQQAGESARGFVAGANLDEVGARAAETASNLYRGGRELLAGNEDLSTAADNLSAAVRKTPLPRLVSRFRLGFCWRSSLAVRRNAKRHRGVGANNTRSRRRKLR
jgi:hypothetical protein